MTAPLLLSLQGALAQAPARLEAASLTLDDGLRVVAVQRADATRSVLVAALPGGRATEPSPGLAAAVGAAWFDGRVTPSRTVRDEYRRIGAQTDWRLTLDTLLYRTEVDDTALDEALTLEWLRFSEPLAGVTRLPTPASEVDARAALQPVAAALWSAEQPLAALGASLPDAHPLYVGVDWVAEQWRAERSVLVVWSPRSPAEVLCTVAPATCAEATAVSLDALDTLPDPGPVPNRRDEAGAEPIDPGPIGPVLSGVSPALRMAWTTPGTESLARGALDYAASRMRDELAQVAPASCELTVGAAEGAIVCTLPAATSIADVKASLRRGWSERRLAKDVEAWRSAQLEALAGTVTAPDLPERMALELLGGGTPIPYPVLRPALAFDDRHVRALLRGPLAPGRVLWVLNAAR